MVEKKGKSVMDFGWGDTRGVRGVFVKHFSDISKIQFFDLSKMGYSEDAGDPALIEQFKALTFRLTGKNYKYICVTSGCTQAVFSSLKSIENKQIVLTRDMYFPRYPGVILKAGLLHKTKSKIKNEEMNDAVVLVDSPSNPLGNLGNFLSNESIADNSMPVIWDGAYHTPTYGILDKYSQSLSNDIFCGSFGKLTGINGIRIGWAATDNEGLYGRITAATKNTTCGASSLSMELAKIILNKDRNRDLENFFYESRNLIDNNRVEVSRMATKFGLNDIPNYGMFAFFEIDEKLKKLFDKSMVKFTNGADCGAECLSVRVNLGNSNESTKKMVDTILKNDRRK